MAIIELIIELWSNTVGIQSNKTMIGSITRIIQSKISPKKGWAIKTLEYDSQKGAKGNRLNKLKNK